MFVAPEGHWRPGMLAAIEAEFFALRRRAPDITAAFKVGFAHAVGDDPRGTMAEIYRAGLLVCAAVDAQERDAELAYHNRWHFAEAVLAYGWLCGMARRMSAVSPDETALGVVAMVGHDLLHDGSAPNGGVMEAQSADAVAEATAACDLDQWQRAVIRAVILGTDPGLVAANAARATRDLPMGPFGRSVDVVIAMANEADVFSSLLPNLGWHLTRRLAQERRRAGHASAAELSGPGNRLAFLTTYARLTPAARRLGLAELRGWQVAASERLVEASEEGASTLDILSAPATDRHFLAAPRRIASGLE